MTVDHAPPGDITVKKSVTIPRSLAERIEERTGPRGFSQFVTEALAYALARQGMREYADEYLKDHEPFTAEEIEEAERAWRGE